MGHKNQRVFPTDIRDWCDKQEGITKRELFAAIIAASGVYRDGMDFYCYVKSAIRIADDLIEELDKQRVENEPTRHY